MQYDQMFGFLFCCAWPLPPALPSARFQRLVDELARLGRMRDHVDACDADFAAAGQRTRGADADGGGLARAVRAEQAEDLALLDCEIDAVQGHDTGYAALLAFVDLCQGFDLDNQRWARLGAGNAYLSSLQEGHFMPLTIAEATSIARIFGFAQRFVPRFVRRIQTLLRSSAGQDWPHLRRCSED